jgi:predicted dehydrogenase
MNDKVAVGVVGIGHLGLLHAKMYSEIDQAQFVGIFDIDRQKCEKIAGEFEVTAFKTYDALLSNVQAVSVATPTITHFDIAKEALVRGVHTFIEKPITQTVEEAAGLIKIAGENRCKIQVGHIERFNPAILSLENHLANPMFIESHRLDQFRPRGVDVAVVLDLMIHDIDLILSLVKSPIASIDANGVPVVSDTVDIANARIRFENGCVANVTASRISQKKMRKMRLFQRDAYISVDFQLGLLEVFRLVDENDDTAPVTMMLGQIEKGSVKRRIIYEQPEVKEVNALKYELELFIKAIQNDTEPVVNGEDGKRALEVAHEIMDRIQNQPRVI